MHKCNLLFICVYMRVGNVTCYLYSETKLNKLQKIVPKLRYLMFTNTNVFRFFCISTYLIFLYWRWLLASYWILRVGKKPTKSYVSWSRTNLFSCKNSFIYCYLQFHLPLYLNVIVSKCIIYLPTNILSPVHIYFSKFSR